MDSKELTKEIWKIVDTIKEDPEKGYKYFIQSHKNIPDEFYEVFCLELQKMCCNLSLEYTTTNPTSVVLSRVLIFLKNDRQILNPTLKLKFREKPKVKQNSFVKYFSLLRQDGVITNTIDELIEILESITGDEFSSISSYLKDQNGKLGKNSMLLPRGYSKISVPKKINPS